MKTLMRASEMIKRPVVTMAGEDVAQIKDIVYFAGGGSVGGFTLNGRGLLSSPLKTSLAWGDISAFGSDAVMITDESKLHDTKEMLSTAGAAASDPGGDVLNSRVLTDDGADLGKIVDVIIEVDDTGKGYADVVGYEIEPSAALGSDKKRLLIPLPDTIAVSAEHLMVPASARNFVVDDLAGFGAAVDDFRKQLKGKQ